MHRFLGISNQQIPIIIHSQIVKEHVMKHLPKVSTKIWHVENLGYLSLFMTNPTIWRFFFDFNKDITCI